ncbi:heavy metal translocating P-type ATPase [Caenimonas aquaedulcis]|uniref:Cadmium-translocating P-type ATPase n=1 Tax=Caenimonas aquaedulcis TaxID=2793270 RepID=A0A931MIT6_9BURK|nr:cation-translocating P-type ATPase [Caenimonas aquaedulcis]MBG9390184.1 cadmium-translocating P-type ATPase [Caenimonas aquaedulcis]
MQSNWIALDDAREWEVFSRPLAGREGWRESWLAIEGMHCAGCTLAVEDALGRLPGVEGVRVNGAARTARIAWSPACVLPSRWMQALDAAGYGAVPAPDLLLAAPRGQAQRVLLWRWLVAGFCMMQVMMYAVPAYVAQPGDITPDIAGLLAWASWVLTLPVVLFSCRPFFSAAWRDMRSGRVGMDVPVALGVAVAFGASTMATFDPAGPWGREVWFDSVTMFVFFLLSGRLLEQRLRDRTAGALEALMRRMPQSVERRMADGSFERVAARRLAIGDVVRVLPGEAFPADGVVAEGESQVDEALLTGESQPLARRPGDEVIAGSHNLRTPLVVHVERLGAQTRYAEIVALMERASLEKPRAAQLADRIAGPFLLGVVVAAFAAAAWWWPVDPARALAVAIAVLIVTCPCALSLATPAATLAAAGALARRGVLVRRLGALEACASIDTVIFDKTGTLTQAGMALSATRCRDGIDAARALALAAALARHSLHPVSRAIVDAAGDDGARAENVEEVAGQGVQGTVVDGASRHLLKLGSAAFCGVPQPQAADGPQVHLADDAGWLASFGFEEALQPGAAAAVDALRAGGVRVELLSGDRPQAAAQLGRRIGIADARGGCLPQDKLAHLRAAQARGHRVAMVGDGFNDAPVLASADVSIAMGHAVPLAQAKCDFIVQGSRLAAVPALLRHARRVRAVVRQNLAWAAAYNIVCVPLAALGAMPPWLAGLGMAASSLLVVANSARLASFEAGA